MIDRRDRLFWLVIVGMAIGLTVYRYADAALLYPNLGDDAWAYLHSQKQLIFPMIFGAPGPRPLYFILVHLLSPHYFNPGFLPDSFPLWSYGFIPEMRYAIFSMGAVVFWIIPVAGFVAWRLTQSRVAGVIVAALMAFSPYQNLIATTLQPHVVQMLPLMFIYYRVWCVDPKAENIREKWQAGLLTGLLCSIAVMLNYHNWFFVGPMGPVLMACLFVNGVRRFPDPLVRSMVRSVREIAPYGAAMLISLMAPLVVIDIVFRVNEASGGIIFKSSVGTFPYFTAAFALPFELSASIGTHFDFSLSEKISGFKEVLLDQFGIYGLILILVSVFWGLYCVIKGVRDAPSFSIIGTLIVSYMLIHASFVPPYGRLTMPLEFPAYVLIAKLVVDAAAGKGRWKLLSWPVFAGLLMMYSHMAFSSGVILEDMLGSGRAAKWLTENSQGSNLYYASGNYAGGPSLTPLSAQELGPDASGYLLAVTETDKDWVSILEGITPVRSWRTNGTGLKSFHVIGSLPYEDDYYFDHFVVYDLGEVIKAINDTSS